MTNEVATRLETAPAEAEQPSEAAAILQVIERAAQNPAVDVDKMERLLAMRERVMERQAKQAFTEAKLRMRNALPEISMRGMITIREKNPPHNIIQETPFARFEDIHAAVMPVLTEHGFDLSFKNGMAPDGKVRVTTILSHVDGHSEETYFDLPHDSTGSKNAVQAVGSATSYGKRYGTLSILNIRVVGEDDDGDLAGRPDTITNEQNLELGTLADEVGADMPRFLQFLGVDKLSDLPASQFDKAKSALQLKRSKA